MAHSGVEETNLEDSLSNDLTESFNGKINLSENSPSGVDLKSLVFENQSIKLIPSVEEVVKNTGLDFDINLDIATEAWLREIRKNWNSWKKTTHIKRLLVEYFENQQDPYTSVLKILINSPDSWDTKSNTFPYCFLEEFQRWVNPKKLDLKYLLTSDLKFTAFNVAKVQKNLGFMKVLLDVYQLNDEKDKIFPHISNMLKTHKYKAAYQIIMVLDLHHMIRIEELLVPLILQDKLNMVTSYLDKAPGQAPLLIKYLDDLLNKDETLKNKISRIVVKQEIPEVQWGKIYYKPFGKLIARLCTSYNIPLKECPNLTRHRALGGIHFLITQKYVANVISDNAWTDLVIDTLSNNPELSENLVQMVAEYDTLEAYKWAKYCNLSEDLYPEDVKAKAFTNVMKDEPENWDPVPGTSSLIEYHTLSVAPHNVVFVDNYDLFHSVLYNELIKETLIGLDSEWKPSFGTKASCVSLIQIATVTKVFLFDVIVLNDSTYSVLWAVMAEHIFDNSSVIKIGFGLENDMHEIKASVEGLHFVRSKGSGYLELSKLNSLIQRAGVSMTYQKQNVGEGLSSIVEQCFGKGLNKHEQCSNWENRPLRDTQLNYAALDAHVLIEIYFHFKFRCLESQVSFEDICYQAMSTSVKSKNRKTKKKSNATKFKKTSYPLKREGEPKAISTLKLVMKNELCSLASVLRYCGFDTVLCREGSTWEQCVQLANDEHRYLVCNDGSQINTNNKCLLVLHSNTLFEQIKEIINIFNVNIHSSNLFTRCQDCNGCDMWCVPQQKLSEMVQIYKSTYLSNNLPKNQQGNSGMKYCSYLSTAQSYDDYYMDGFLSDNEPEEPTFVCHREKEQVPNNYLDNCRTRYGTPVKLECLSEDVIIQNNTFYICQLCGKCFWEGSSLPEDLHAEINGIVSK